MKNRKIVLNDNQMARLSEEMDACARRLDELQARLGLSMSPQTENQAAVLDADPIGRLDEEIEACATRLDELNVRFPNLATIVTREAVEYWRSRNRHSLTYEQRESDHAGHDEVYVKGLAIGLLADHADNGFIYAQGYLPPVIARRGGTLRQADLGAQPVRRRCKQ